MLPWLLEITVTLDKIEVMKYIVTLCIREDSTFGIYVDWIVHSCTFIDNQLMWPGEKCELCQPHGMINDCMTVTPNNWIYKMVYLSLCRLVAECSNDVIVFYGKTG